MLHWRVCAKRDSVIGNRFVGQTVKRRLWDEAVGVLVVKQNAAHLHAHQAGDALVGRGEKFFFIGECAECLRDFLQADHLGITALLLLHKTHVFYNHGDLRGQ